MISSVIELRNVITSRGDKQVLRGIDLDVPRGSVVGFLGRRLHLDSPGSPRRGLIVRSRR
jgi:ABC-type polar amino acid transport system ATPase subunit